MRKVAVLGAGGFVGSAFAALLANDRKVELARVTRGNYAALRGRSWDVVIDCSGNSRKYLADQSPLKDFDRSVTQRLRTLLDFPAELQVHVSSVDVYNDLSSPTTTHEDATIDPRKSSTYGFHKWLAEQLVMHNASRWLIVRLAGMVGPGMKKNPVYDVLNCQPLRIHADSRYQYLLTADVARLVLRLVEQERAFEVFNVCGDGLISPREIAALAGRTLDVRAPDASAKPRVVDVCIDRLREVSMVPSTSDCLRRFLSDTAPIRHAI